MSRVTKLQKLHRRKRPPVLLRVYDPLGRVVRKKRGKRGAPFRLRITGLRRGLYTLTAQADAHDGLPACLESEHVTLATVV